MALKFYFILAKTESNGIGYKGQLPWKLKKELGYFQRMTKTVSSPGKKNAVIMGRLTWESMPDGFKPLADRLNVVLSSQKLDLKGALHCFSLEEVVEKLKSAPYSEEIETAWIIGGSKVYEAAIEKNLCDRIYMTHIQQEFPCDTFVNINTDKGFKEITDERVDGEIQEENGVKYVFKVYEKV